ncbi:hypothetical protein D3C81_1791290 [compost metagenome]
MVESRRLMRSSQPTCRVRLSISWDLRYAPRKVCGSKRVGLAKAIGRKVLMVPSCNSLFDARTLPVRPSSEYSLAGSRVVGLYGSRPVPVRSGEESRRKPSIPWASRPKPTSPSV